MRLIVLILAFSPAYLFLVGCGYPVMFHTENVVWQIKVVSHDGQPLMGAVVVPGDDKNPKMNEFREFTDKQGAAKIFIPYGGERWKTIFGLSGSPFYYPQRVSLHITAEGYREVVVDRARADFAEERPGPAACLHLVRRDTLTLYPAGR
jgi:hypothetical protein